MLCTEFHTKYPVESSKIWGTDQEVDQNLNRSDRTKVLRNTSIGKSQALMEVVKITYLNNLAMLYSHGSRVLVSAAHTRQ
jgi:hypothetical protein